MTEHFSISFGKELFIMGSYTASLFNLGNGGYNGRRGEELLTRSAEKAISGVDERPTPTPSILPREILTPKHLVRMGPHMLPTEMHRPTAMKYSSFLNQKKWSEEGKGISSDTKIQANGLR